MAAAAIERLQLLAEILGAALQRCRHENALRAGLAEIERLNAQLQADNRYLKEEIKTITISMTSSARARRSDSRWRG